MTLVMPRLARSAFTAGTSIKIGSEREAARSVRATGVALKTLA
jgi:hypothetical protein